jgi:hypothetical protein
MSCPRVQGKRGKVPDPTAVRDLAVLRRIADKESHDSLLQKSNMWGPVPSILILVFPGHYLQEQDDAPRQGRFQWGTAERTRFLGTPPNQKEGAR